MEMLLSIPIEVRLLVIFVAGTCLGSWANWAIYGWAWQPRAISPWTTPPENLPARGWLDRLPILGWWRLRREASCWGAGFWLRPMFLELAFGVALAWLYWWEVDQLALIGSQQLLVFNGPLLPANQFVPGLAAPSWVLHATFLSHVALCVLMLVATMIDVDDRIIPDEVTVPGTLLGILLAAAVPMSLLPHVAERAGPPAVGTQHVGGNGVAAVGPRGLALFIEPVTAAAPNEWPAALEGFPRARALAIGLGCYWLWCFALAPRIWRSSRGRIVALQMIAARVGRELRRPPRCFALAPRIWRSSRGRIVAVRMIAARVGHDLRRPTLAVLAVVGTLVITAVWWWGGSTWLGMFSALISLAVAGLFVWGVRIVCTHALGVEALGFGDVTLMMMIGTFLGWQACLVLFFLAPLAGLVIGIVRLLLGQGNILPYGPFLCLAAIVTIVAWAPIWSYIQLFAAVPHLIAAVLIVCLVLMWAMLTVWRGIKMLIFGREDLSEVG